MGTVKQKMRQDKYRGKPPAGKTVQRGSKGRPGLWIGEYKVTEDDCDHLWVKYISIGNFPELGIIKKLGNKGVFVSFDAAQEHSVLCYCSTLQVASPPKLFYTVEDLLN